MTVTRQTVTAKLLGGKLRFQDCEEREMKCNGKATGTSC